MKVYTRTGDQGMTALFGGDRVAKTHPLIEAYGTVDETNAHLGAARAADVDRTELADLDAVLERIQRELFVLGADLATPVDSKRAVRRVDEADVRRVERDIDRFDADLPALRRFILPGGSKTASHLHIARTVCRRAERLCVHTAALQPINDDAIRYLNRLSDLLFVLSRWANQQTGHADREWLPGTEG